MTTLLDIPTPDRTDVHVEPAPLAPTAKLDLPRHVAAASDARRFIRGQLADPRFNDIRDTAVLLCSELFANACLHARGRAATATVTVAVEGNVVQVEVTDPDPRVHRPRPSESGEHQRGLFLVEQMSDRYGRCRTDAGKSVWFVLDASAGAS